MKTTDFSATITSSKLKENMNKMFGLNVNFDKYDREQLEDMRNKLRTRVFQQEGRAGINDLLTNETYQKDKAMLDLLNTRIKEMLGEDIKKLRDKMTELSEAKKGVKAPKYKIHSKGTAAKDYDGDGKKESPKDEVWGSRAKAAAKSGKPFESTQMVDPNSQDPVDHAASLLKRAGFSEEDVDGLFTFAFSSGIPSDAGPNRRKMISVLNKNGIDLFDLAEGRMNEGKKPDFLDMDKDGNKKEPMKKAAKDAKVKEGFPTVADAKARHEKEKTTGKFDKKDTGTGTTYTRKASTFTDGGDDSDTKAAKKKAKSTSEAKDDGKKFDPLKHVKNPTPGEKKAAKDVKRGSYADRAAMLKSAEKDGRLKESHSIYKRHVAIVNESLAVLLAEDEEGKAKAITAAGDMVNDYTSWMQRVGQYQTKTMIELADAIKADFGAAEAEAFKQAVGPALSATLEVLTQQREAVSNAVAVLAGEATPDMGNMGMEPGMDTGMPADEPGMDIAAPDDMNAPAPAGDEFGASDAAAGVGTTGREMRESKFARKLAESHSIMSKLAK